MMLRERIRTVRLMKVAAVATLGGFSSAILVIVVPCLYDPCNSPILDTYWDYP